MGGKANAGLASALVPIGAVAAVAGCSGGGVNSSGAYVPPTSGGTVGTTKAQISVSFAVQSASTARSAQALRKPQAVPTDAEAIGVRFIAQDGTVETEQMFVLPQPVPASTTLTVSAPIGNDQIALAVYEPWPTSECAQQSGLTSLVRRPSSKVQASTLNATQQKRAAAFAAARASMSAASLAARQAQAFRHPQTSDPTPPANTYPINGYYGTAAISANGTNTISAQVSPVAFGADVHIDSGPIGCYGQWIPLENLAQTQTAVMEVDPYDICGTSFGQGYLGVAPANLIAVTGPSGVVLPSPIPVPVTSSGAQFTVTYAANQAGGGTLQNGIVATPYYPLDPTFAAQFASINTVDVIPDYFIFALDSGQSYLSVYDAIGNSPIGQQQVGRGEASAARSSAQGIRSATSLRSQLASAWRSRTGSRSTQGFMFGGSSGASLGPITAMDAANVSACPGGYAAAVAVVGQTADSAKVDVLTVSQDSSGNRTLSEPSQVIWPSGDGIPTAVAFDSACRLYVGDDFGYLGAGSITGMTSVQPITANVVSGSPAPITSIVADGSTMYAAYNDYSTLIAQVATFSAGTAGPVSSPVFSAASPLWADALALAGGQVWLAYEDVSSGSAYVAQLPGSTSSSIMLPGGYLYGFAGTMGQATLYEASAGYLFSVAGGAVTNLTSANGLSANGVAVSLDSPTSTLWLSDPSTGDIFGYLVSNYSQPYWLQVPVITNAYEGPLSIAP